MDKSSSMDLDRLKIPDAPPSSRGGGWRTVVLCLFFLTIGFCGATFWRQAAGGSVLTVETVPAVGADSRGAVDFTAGGWIEVGRPAWPLVVSGRVSERLETLTVREGETVLPGKVIATLYDLDIRLEHSAALAEAAVVESRLAHLQAGYREEEVRAAEALAAEAAEQERLARANLERSRKLPADTISREQLDRDLADCREAEARHSLANAELAKMKAGPRKEEIAIAEAELERAKRKAALVAQRLEYCTLKVPDVGRPLRVLRVLRNVGEWIDVKDDPAVVWLYDPGEMQMRVDVPQSSIRSVVPGRPAEVVTEANPDRVYAGTVLRLEPLAELSKNTVTVRVKIDDPDDLLFPEMVARVSFSSTKEDDPGDSSGGAWVPTAALLSDPAGTFLYVVDGGKALRRDVIGGRERNGRTLIQSGVRAGERVVVSPPPGLRTGHSVEEK